MVTFTDQTEAHNEPPSDLTTPSAMPGATMKATVLSKGSHIGMVNRDAVKVLRTRTGWSLENFNARLAAFIDCEDRSCGSPCMGGTWIQAQNEWARFLRLRPDYPITRPYCMQALLRGSLLHPGAWKGNVYQQICNPTRSARDLPRSSQACRPRSSGREDGTNPACCTRQIHSSINTRGVDGKR